MESLKIVHCANFSESKFGQVFYSIDRKISNGLIRNGHFVYDFSYREIARNATFFKRKKLGAKKMNEKLLDTMHNMQADLLLLGHSELVYTHTLKRIKESFPHIKIAMWWVDWLKDVDTIVNRLPYLDVIFTTTGVSESTKVIKGTKTTVVYFPNMCDKSIDTYKAFKGKTVYDIFYAGRYDNERKDLVNKLKTLSTRYKVGLFGLDKASILLGSKYIATIGESKVAINYSRKNNISLYSSDRIIQLIANGTLVFTPKVPDFEKLFTSKEVIYFDDLDDLEDKLNYYLLNENARIKIAKEGYNKAHSLYDSKTVTKFMIETIFNIAYSKRYGWEDEIIRNEKK